MIKDLRLVANAELRALRPQGVTPEDAKTGDQQPDKQPKTIEGYALLFNSPSKDLGGFVEVIDPKALDGVDLSNVIMLDQHDYSKPLASVKAGTLKLDTDEKGLHFTATLDDSVSYANDAYANVKSGNVDSMSFRFDVDDGGDEFTQDDQGNVTRTIKRVKDLFEVSTVTIPAYDDSNVQVDK
ncbi:HK97 family phage prohead protease, partial [Lactiplantibacillus plantarum]